MMNRILEDCLFIMDKRKFEELKEEAYAFRGKYIGDNILPSGACGIGSTQAPSLMLAKAGSGRKTA